MNMHGVGHHLQVTAWKKTPPDRDAYARSAFNRYYYGVFLTVRDMFRKMGLHWEEMRHASFPEVLSGQITKEFSKAKNRARKNNDYELEQKIHKVKSSIYALKELVTKANEIRKVADYEPDEPVLFTGEPRFSLKSVDVTEAHAWDGNARILCGSILPVWEQINV